MFESFKARNEELNPIEFENWKVEDAKIQELTLEVTTRMAWETEGDEDGEQVAVSFEPEEGYEEALKKLQKYLDNKGRRYSENAIAIALAKILDVGDYGYVDTLTDLG